ncbi:hypothetical protein EK21DRAFT_117592 [Setomelanomma holmii]|uniref:Uncharacterized protein n=1 Tax=Setomelanomma holmii TaxID=210430 RepID=A0A9P4GX76_9PLEO|nr:hypothetical protein EK21DRAFT_117592 [Setomelanomma holmii]
MIPSHPANHHATQTPNIEPSATKLEPANQHRDSAPVSTIAAVLATGYDDLDAQRRADRKNKTLRERWRDFKARNFRDYDVAEDRAQAEGRGGDWNVVGGKVGGGLASPYRGTGGK